MNLSTSFARHSATVVVAGFALLWLLLFAPLLVNEQVPAFRDSGNYYYPLFQWQCSEWRQGQIPLWNPFVGLGSPSFAETTTSVLYPGKLIFACPLSFPVRYLLYIALHVAFAGVTTFFTARRWGASHLAAGIAAVSYAFAGTVLFQVHNVVFLVSAAWLPLAVCLLERMIATRSYRAAVQFGAVLAMMVLGGDPQLAYNTGLLAALYAFFYWRDRKSSETNSDAASPLPSPISNQANWRDLLLRPYRLLTKPRALLLLLVAAGSGTLLSAVQVLPAVEQTRRSDRMVFDRPRNLLEVGRLVRSEGITTLPAKLGALIAPPPPDSHQARSLDYSLGPWQLSEAIWPNCSGNFFPINCRWTSALPSQGRIWTPSIYFGLVPLVLALSCVRHTDRRSRWMIYSALIFLVAALGRYGLGWVLSPFRGGESLDWADASGGVYWWMSVCLPGYSLFRYPAKLAVVSTLMLSLLAASGADDAARHGRLFRPAVGIALLSGLLLLALLALKSQFHLWLAGAPADSLFGPLDAQGATAQLQRAFIHTLIVALSFAAALRLNCGLTSLFLLTVVDIGIANSQLVSSVEADLINAHPAVLRELDGQSLSDVRIARGRISPPAAWRSTSNPARLADVVAWERATLKSLHHLPDRVRLLDAATTFRSSDLQAMLHLQHESSLRTPIDQLLSVDHRFTEFANPSRYELAKMDALPRAWLVHETFTLETSGGRAPDSARQVLLDHGTPRDFRRVAVVTPEEHRLDAVVGQPASRCRITDEASGWLRIAVSTDRPALLVVNDLFYPGWTATLTTASGKIVGQPVVRANHVMRGVFIPPGQCQVEMRYQPLSFRLGASISGLSWAALIVAGGLSIFRRRLTGVGSAARCV